MKSLFRIAASSVLLSVSLLAGCGGGGGAGGAASSISGIAAAGAPIIGTVTIKDSATPFNTKTVTIAADGKYTIDVTGLSAPFMLRADGNAGGRDYSIYSAAASADINGTINVTPLTDLIVANIAGQIASNFFAAGNFSKLTAAELSAQETALQARLQPILAAAGVADSIDLLRSSFAADHTGLDRALDGLRVTVDPLTARATIVNIIDNQQIIDDLASKTDTTVIVATPNFAAGLTELQQIVAKFDAFSALFATTLPAVNNATLLALFDPAFLFDGENTAGFLSELTSQQKNLGIKFTNVTLVPGSMTPAGAPTTAKVSLSVVQKLGESFSIELDLKKSGSAWKLSGNQRISEAEANSFARLQEVSLVAPPVVDTGLRFEIKVPTVAGLASLAPTLLPPAGAGYYAIVSGAGLPLAGALFVSDFSQNDGSFFAAAGSQTAYVGSTTPRLNNFGFNQYPLSNAAIAALGDNEIYVIEIRHDNGTPTVIGDDVLLATYNSNAGKRPYLTTELTIASFATITAPTKAALGAFANSGGTMTVNWTLPTTTLGAKSSHFHFFRSSTGSNSFNVDLLSTATSTSLTMPAASGLVQSSGISLFITDSFGRELSTQFNGS